MGVDFVDDGVVIEGLDEGVVEADEQLHQVFVAAALQGDAGVLTVVGDGRERERRHGTEGDLAAGVHHEPLEGGEWRRSKAAGRARRLLRTGFSHGAQAASAVGVVEAVRRGATFHGSSSSSRVIG